MRKINALLAAVLTVLVLLHSVMGSFMVLAIGHNGGKLVALAAAVILALHAVCGAILTRRSLRRLTPAFFRANSLYWLRRLTGIAVIVLLWFHVGLFGTMTGSQYILYEFTLPRLAVQIAFILAFLTHIALNLRPLFITLGWTSFAAHCRDGYVLLAVVGLFTLGAMGYYYIGWQTL